MLTVSTISELLGTINTLEKYLASKKDPEYSFALDRVKKGTCFVAVKHGEEYKFYPSRFIGYIDNTMANHLNSEDKDGRETNPAISKIIGSKPQHDSFLNEKYVAYCIRLGIKAAEKGAFGVERKFWVIG
jgi:hypothetical protein